MALATRRFPGARWSIVYGSYEGPEAFAVNELQRIAQNYLPYVIEVQSADRFRPEAVEHVLTVGTAANNPLIADFQRRRILQIPAQPEGFAAACLDAPWNSKHKAIAVGGNDNKGVANGVAEFCTRIVGGDVGPLIAPERQRSFDNIPAFNFHEQPAFENRGIWSWGYVIFDYRRFFDNMARLKMNMVVIWNDAPPLNSPQIIEYAHQLGIKVVYAFHWGWGLEEIDLANSSDRQKIKENVIHNYDENYSHFKIDGIYFQTLTENTNVEKGGESTAALVCELVNDIGRTLLDKYPHLYIQFGLHATSIIDHYPDLKPLDPRIAIIWEDAGVTPFAYSPALTIDPNAHLAKCGLGNFEGTLNYAKALATFRGNAEFGMCPKGFSNLSWGDEFEHHGQFIMGERSSNFIIHRFEEKREWLAVKDRQWMRCYPAAARFYREIREASKSVMTMVALIEDGLFEHYISVGAALFAEMAWNPHRPDEELLGASLSHYYR